MNPTGANNTTNTDSRRRRTSVSSTASTRSSWRVPLAKQPPRTQLSAVFAEGEAPSSRSPSHHQSAFSLLEARYAASSTTTLSPSANLSTRVRVDETFLEESSVETPIFTGTKHTGSPTRGRQSTRRNLSLAGAEALPAQNPPTTQLANSTVPESTNASPSVIVQPAPPAQNGNPEVIGPPPTANTQPDILTEQKKGKQPSVASGWFGASGRSKTQKVVPVVDPPEPRDAPVVSSSTSAPIVSPSTQDDIRMETPAPPLPASKPEENSPPPATSNNATAQPSSSSWFSLFKPAAPVSVPPPSTTPVASTAITQSSSSADQVAVVSDPVVSQAPIPTAASTAIPAAPNLPPDVSAVSSSPGRASWFGSFRGRVESITATPPPPIPPLLHGLDTSAPQTPYRAATLELGPEPPSALSESMTDESMTATITPMTFAEAQARTQASSSAGAQSWFRMRGKRESTTPSVDSTVPSLPSLPPSPKQEHAPMTVIVPVNPPSVSSLGSSTARYTLSFPLLGKPKVKLEDVLREIGNDAIINNQQATTPAANLPSNLVPEISAEMIIDSPSQVASSSASISSQSSAQPPPSATWWRLFGRPTGPITVPQDVSLSNPGPVVLAEGVPLTAPSSIAASSMDGQPIPTSTQQAGGEGINNSPLPDSASWLGFWPWGNNAPPNSGSSERPEIKRGKTAAELVKEEAMARDQNNSVASNGQPTPSASTTIPELPSRIAELTSAMSDQNPISNDSVENRASWTSFFSLRTVQVSKRITVQEGPEEDVMDLDGDPNAPVVAPAATTADAMAAKGVGKSGGVPVVVPKPSSKPAGRSSSTDPPGSRTGKTPNPPLTDSASIRGKVVPSTQPNRSSSASPSNRSLPPLPLPKAPNMVLPTFGDTFYTLPRALPPYNRSKATPLRRIMSGILGIGGPGSSSSSSLDDMREWQSRSSYVVPKDYEGLRVARDVGRDLPRAGGVLGAQDIGGIRDCKRVAILGVHGWFPGAIMRTLLGEPTGTSPKFASMMETAVLEFMEKHEVTLEKVTSIPLEGDGTIERRVEKLYNHFLSKKEWVEDLQEADVIFVATHSQGCVVSTQLLDKLIADGHIRTAKNWEIVKTIVDVSNSVAGLGVTIPPARPPQRICCLALCGIHLGPLLYLGTSSFVNPYIQYFESAAARELFEFQDTETEVSKRYLASLESVLSHGVKFVYVASLDDQVVPIYSGIFTAVNHPRILRALYIDGDAYSSSDFLSNLVVLLIRLRNAGIDDGGLLMHLSEATAGSLSGVGHSTAYLDPGGYELAVRYLFETSDALGEEPTLEVEAFTAKASRNDYEIPWALRGLISDPRCQELFGKELIELRKTFDNWHPRTSAMREVRKKLEPIRGRRSRFAPDPFHSLQSPFSAATTASPTSPVFPKTNN